VLEFITISVKLLCGAQRKALYLDILMLICLVPACACEYGLSGMFKPILAWIFTLFFDIAFFLLAFSGPLRMKSQSSPSLQEN